jgi:two-component system nitrate/nitrite response regulator NarL
MPDINNLKLFLCASVLSTTHFKIDMQTPPLPIRIMLIDDHRSVLWGLEKLIGSAQPAMEVVGTATNSAEALSLIGSISPDVILIDLELDNENGVNIIPRLIEQSKALVLALTGTHDLTLHDSAMLAGARGVVGKADTAETILKAIAMVHRGEIWIERSATSRIINQLSRRKTAVSASPEQQKIATLTRKEKLTVAEIGHDAMVCTRIIAARLSISENTLRNHLTSIYAKLDLGNRLELYAYARKHGINKMVE